jgi:chloride channel protein, CIC family
MTRGSNGRKALFLARRGALRWLFRLRQVSRLDDKSWFLVLVVLVGLGAALVSRAAELVTDLVQYAALGATGDSLPLLRAAETWKVILIPALGGLAFSLILYLRKSDAGDAGIPEIMEAVSLKGSGRLRLRRVLNKSLASLVLNATGGSVGREGPLVQTGSALASALGRAVKMPGHRLRVLVGCGVAAGMAVVYDAPVGAAFFAMEVIFGNFALDVFGPLVIASVVATLAANPLLVTEPLFRLSDVSLRSGWEIGAFVLAGAVGALGIQALRRTLGVVEKLFARFPVPSWLKVSAGGLVVGLLASRLPEVWGNGREVVQEVLGGGIALQLLLLLVVFKVVATAFSLGSGGAGGIFTPSLLVGASLGSALGIGLARLAPQLIGSTTPYGAAGMAGALAALTHAPVTGVIMVFDLTRDYALLIPLMLASVAGAVIANRFEDRSIYADRLRRRGVDLDMAFEDLALGSLRASDLMRLDPPTIHGDESLPELQKILGEKRENQAIVVDSDGRPVGIVDLRDVVEYSADVAAGRILLAWDLARFVEPLAVATPLSAAMEKIWRLDSALLPVVDPALGGKLVGGLARKDLLNAFDREMLRKRLLLTRFLVSRGREGGEPGVRRSEDYVMVEHPVPASMQGKSLADLDLPAGRRLLVVALRRGEGASAEEFMPPPADMPLREGDRLVLLGHREQVNVFQG